MIAWEAAAGPTVPPVRASEARPLGNTQAIAAAAGHCNFKSQCNFNRG
jgi:hypothetical protein